MKILTYICLTICAAVSSMGQMPSTNLYSNDPGGLLPFFVVANLPSSYDDTNSSRIPITPIYFCGTWYSNLWVNEDGNVTLDNSFGGHQPPAYVPALALTNLNRVIFAPFWADCDTTTTNGSGTVSWGNNATVIVRSNVYCPVFYATWRGVGYYKGHNEKTNSFQMLIIYRNDISWGSFDLQYRYAGIQWDTADSGFGTGGKCNFGGGYPARAGYAGSACALELTNSGTCGAFLDGTPSSLVSNYLSPPDYQQAVKGVYTWQFPSTNIIVYTNLSLMPNAVPSAGSNLNKVPMAPPQ